MKKVLCKIQLGTWLEWFIDKITFGNGALFAYSVAHFLGFQSCGCEERKRWLNRLTCKEEI
jgi:hypothetical protein